MNMKLFGLGIKLYVKDKQNIFDCVIVVLSSLDIILNYSLNSTSKAAITAFRAFRLLRVFKLA